VLLNIEKKEGRKDEKGAALGSSWISAMNGFAGRIVDFSLSHFKLDNKSFLSSSSSSSSSSTQDNSKSSSPPPFTRVCVCSSFSSPIPLLLQTEKLIGQ